MMKKSKNKKKKMMLFPTSDAGQTTEILDFKVIHELLNEGLERLEQVQNVVQNLCDKWETSTDREKLKTQFLLIAFLLLRSAVQTQGVEQQV